MQEQDFKMNDFLTTNALDLVHLVTVKTVEPNQAPGRVLQIKGGQETPIPMFDCCILDSEFANCEEDQIVKCFFMWWS